MTERILPGLILLDLNMPLVDGWEALAAIKDHNDLKSVPVITFTTSSVPDHVCHAYGMHAAGFITKPTSYHEVLGTTECVHSYRFTTAVRAARKRLPVSRASGEADEHRSMRSK